MYNYYRLHCYRGGLPLDEIADTRLEDSKTGF